MWASLFFDNDKENAINCSVYIRQYIDFFVCILFSS